MGIDPKARAVIEKKVCDFFSALDTSGENTKFYRNLFKTMDDKKFAAFMDILEASVDGKMDNFWILQVIDFERNDMDMSRLEAGSKSINVPLMEKVAIPSQSSDPSKPVLTAYEVPVGYLHHKRMQQSLIKKNSSSVNTTKRNKYNQASSKDKNGRSSDAENYALLAIGCKDILRELLGPRADDSVMKNEMYSQIAKYGYTSLNTLTNSIDNKTTLKMVDAFLMCMGFMTDLVNKSMILKSSLEK